MTLVERLFSATVVLMLAYAMGAFLFFSVRGIAARLLKGFEGVTVPRYMLGIVLGCPAAVTYAFVLHPVAGLLVLLPLLVLLLFPELSMVNWRTEPSVMLADKVQLTKPLRKMDGKFATRVTVDGEDWSAVFVDDGRAPPSQGDFVRIVERRGLKVVIARLEKG